MTKPTEDPVTQYKEILDTTRQAARKLAERERTRTVELIAEITTADKAIKAATEAEAQVAQEIAAWWRQVATRMAGLNWMSPGRPPEPDEAAQPEDLEDYVAKIEPATNTLIAALRKASWPRRPT